jgi:transcription termination/antitermination protein NusG
LIRERWRPSDLGILEPEDKQPVIEANLTSDYVSSPLLLKGKLSDVTSVEPLWFAVYTRSRHEVAVKNQLDAKSILNFLPSYTKLSHWKDRRKEIHLPLFPGYLFVKTLLDDRIDVLKTFGVVYIVGNSSGPLPVPEDSIVNIQSILDRGLKVDPHPYLKVGSRVRITDGPLRGIEGILIRKKNRTLLVLSIDLIQRSVSMEIESWKVERI